MVGFHNAPGPNLPKSGPASQAPGPARGREIHPVPSTTTILGAPVRSPRHDNLSGARPRARPRADVALVGLPLTSPPPPPPSALRRRWRGRRALAVLRGLGRLLGLIVHGTLQVGGLDDKVLVVLLCALFHLPRRHLLGITENSKLMSQIVPAPLGLGLCQETQNCFSWEENKVEERIWEKGKILHAREVVTIAEQWMNGKSHQWVCEIMGSAAARNSSKEGRWNKDHPLFQITSITISSQDWNTESIFTSDSAHRTPQK